jgi:2,4-dienoyl-CoA reductase-like NADH-dependent reductase (Old Yellow Enzyme family)
MLSQSIQIHTMTVKNRLAKAAVVENMASEAGQVTDDLVTLYQNASRGGAGLIFTGGAYVQENGRNQRYQTGAHHDGLIEGLSKMAEAGQEEGARIVLQISHAGRQTDPDLVEGDVVGPSPVTDTMTKITPRPLTHDEILGVIESFGLAAGRAREAGFDGVEIMAGHGYLINEFLSRRTNKREDEWGGSLENRARFLLQIVAKIKKTVGPEFPILVKINTEDRMKNGLTLEESLWISKRLQESEVNALKFTGGTYESGLNIARGDIPEDELLADYRGWERLRLKLIIRAFKRKFKFSEAYFLENTRRIKQEIDIPVILVGGLRTPSVMNRIIQDGDADMVALGRPLIRQPFLPRRILSGDQSPADCQNCNRCFIKVSNGLPVRCYAQPV